MMIVSPILSVMLLDTDEQSQPMRALLLEVISDYISAIEVLSQLSTETNGPIPKRFVSMNHSHIQVYKHTAQL